MSTFNSFDALMGQAEQVSTSNKKRNKKKSGSAAAPVPAGQASVPTSNGPAAPAPAAKAPVAAASSVPSIVDVTEASAILERAAREAKTIGDKTRLWKDWVRQVRGQIPMSAHSNVIQKKRTPLHTGSGCRQVRQGAKIQGQGWQPAGV